MATPSDPGKRVIVEGEAEIVRWIFREYVAGRTPRDIAHDRIKIRRARESPLPEWRHVRAR
jgi:hypothetical protein